MTMMSMYHFDWYPNVKLPTKHFLCCTLSENADWCKSCKYNHTIQSLQHTFHNHCLFSLCVFDTKHINYKNDWIDSSFLIDYISCCNHVGINKIFSRVAFKCKIALMCNSISWLDWTRVHYTRGTPF